MNKHQEIISKLKFIGKVRSGEKINVPGMFVQANGLVTKISRTLYSLDNRRNTLNLIKDTIFEVFKILEKESNSNLVDDLINARRGITNLKKTYEGDTKFVCDLETIIESIDSKLLEINHS